MAVLISAGRASSAIVTLTAGSAIVESTTLSFLRALSIMEMGRSLFQSSWHCWDAV